MLAGPLPEIPPIYFYDDEGSALFEQITRLAVYYQTRTEIGILERSAAAIIDVTRPRHLVELGSGAGRKIRLLLDAWSGGGTCTMLDVNALFLECRRAPRSAVFGAGRSGWVVGPGSAV
jgi:L-histidine N-alpha-methyltransferase